MKESLLSSDLRNFPILRDELDAHKEQLLDELWRAFIAENDSKRRFRAGLALAKYATDDDKRWTLEDARLLLDMLLSQIPEDHLLYFSFLVASSVLASHPTSAVKNRCRTIRLSKLCSILTFIQYLPQSV